MAAELVQQGPGVDAGVVAIVEFQHHGVVAHRMNGLDVDPLLAHLQYPLPGPMALDFGRGAVDAQQLAGQSEHLAAVKADLQHA